MKVFATVFVGTSASVLLAICDVGGLSIDRVVSADDLDAGAVADARGLPDGHPSISGFMALPDGHPPVLPEGHPPLPDATNRCPRSSASPWLQPGDAIRVPRESPGIVAI
jgi:hypothetical protein